MTRLKLSACIAAAGLMLTPMTLAAQETAPDPRWTWDLTDLYQSDEDWNRALEEALGGLDEVRNLKGTLSNGPEALLTAFKTNSEWARKGTRVFTYASLGADENLGDPRGQERRQQAQRMFSEFQQATAWMQPEMMALGRETLEAYVKELPEL